MAEEEEDTTTGADDGTEPMTPEMAQAAQGVEFVVLPVACVNEGKGAPLGMGIQRWWAQELAANGGKAAAPVFTALHEQDGRKVPALMVFREPWNDERAVDGLNRFPNAKRGLAVDLKAEDESLSYQARLFELDGEAAKDLKTWSFDGKIEALPDALFGVLKDLAGRLDVKIDHKSWKGAFGTSDHQALVSFLVGLGNLSALQGRCVPTTSDQLLTPFVDAINRDNEMEPAVQGLHMMADILVQSPVDQASVPLCLQALNVAAQRRPKDQSIFHHLGTLFRRLGDVGSAIQSYNQAFNLDPTNEAVTIGFIETLRGAGDGDNAFKVARFAAERNNDSPHLFAHLGSLMIEHDQFDEAEPFLRRAIEDGKVPSAYGDLANVLWDRAGDDGSKEDRGEALSLLRTAIDRPQVAQSTLDMLLDLHEDEKLEQATLLMLKAADLHPSNGTVQRYAATMYLDGDDPSKARPFLDKILELDRRTLDDDAFARRGILSLEFEEFDDRYDAAIEAVRSDDPATAADAAKFLREVIAKEPKYWQPHLMLALAVRGAEGNDAALTHLMNAVRLRPNDSEIRNLIAAILRKQGRAREAVEHLRAVVALNPREIEPVVNLATCLRDANLFDEARQVCSAALQMMPNNTEFKKILDSLPASSDSDSDSEA